MQFVDTRSYNKSITDTPVVKLPERQAAQSFNLLPPDVGYLPTLERFKARPGRFMEQYTDAPSVP